MNKSITSLKFTKYFVILAFIIILLTSIVTISEFFSNSISNDLWHFSNRGLYYFGIYIIQCIILLMILIFTFQLMQKVDIADYFNTINHDKLILIAILTIGYGGLNLAKNYLNASVEYSTLLNTTVETNLLLFILGIVILSSLFIYEESKKIKEENDLTI
ncbi:hypothetical protein KYI09_08175 [Macrococcoides caseolyticum]|uniref:hypothetical protein n=1 Tax=Macrococcoides caseolyticum TaxID=69966 RepID=UPI001C5D9551|nr:hypothetical protein [Macrococcus caseolyticus]QYA39578.1 hypothetical protein KYI09_08175 [Macrococcus caseolyticus]